MALHLKATGIDFTDFSDATESSELLDDYEEGNWAPNHSNFSVSQDAGIYTKVGRLTCANFYMRFGSTATSDGTFTQLPFTTSAYTNATNANFCGNGAWTHLATNAGTTLCPRLNNSATTWTMYASQHDTNWDNTLTTADGDYLGGFLLYYST